MACFKSTNPWPLTPKPSFFKTPLPKPRSSCDFPPWSDRAGQLTWPEMRGFAVKFYTEEGIFDLVGNNIPVFFIQDGVKFLDLVHAIKPEPHHEMPQAASAHDTFWDFISLMPESMHIMARSTRPF